VFFHISDYVTQITFRKNCVAHYLVSIGYAQGCSADKKVWERTQKTSHFKTASNSF